MAQRSFEQVANRHRRCGVLLAPGFETHEVFMGQLNLGGVLYEEDSFVGRNEFPKRCQQRGLAGSGSAGDEQIATLEEVVFEPVGEASVQRGAADQVLHVEVAGGGVWEGSLYGAGAG